MLTDCKHLLQQRITTSEQNAFFSHRATVTDSVLKFGNTSVIFVDLGDKVDGTYYCDLLLSQQLLPATCHVSSKFIFLENGAPAYKGCYVFRH